MTDQPTPPLHEQVRTLEADLVMCREELAQETERAESSAAAMAVPYEDAYGAGYDDAPLPTPDATNPAHLRWAAKLLQLIVLRDGNAKYSNDYGDNVDFRASTLKVRADRLEAAQQQADADEELIEKAARAMAFTAERNDDDVTEAEMWEECLVPESRVRYRRQARALLAANLLRDGDHKAADGGLAPEGGISNGQLLAMDPDRRAEVIASLSPEVCRQLAHIACLGASRLIKESVCDDSHHKARRADEFAELAANLLRDGGEK